MQKDAIGGLNGQQYWPDKMVDVANTHLNFCTICKKFLPLVLSDRFYISESEYNGVYITYMSHMLRRKRV